MSYMETQEAAESAKEAADYSKQSLWGTQNSAEIKID